MDETHEEQAVRAMLQRFGRAVVEGDGAAAAECWEAPALVATESESRPVRTLDEVKAFFSAAQAQYHAQGVYGTRPEVQCIEWHMPRVAAVTVEWPYLDGEGRELQRSESSVYLVRVRDGTARIFTVLMRGVKGG